MKNSPSTNVSPSATDLNANDLDGLGFDGDDAWLVRAREAQSGDPIDRINGYDILDLCGHGGQGVVYRARRADEKIVALKRIHGGARAAPAARRRLLAELDAAGQLAHPNIVKARAADSEGELLIEMDWIDGVPLTAWSRGEPDDVLRDHASLLRVFITICEALGHAHAGGIIHRDLKPSNILVDRDSQPFILDFGLAKPLADLGASRTQATLTGELLGTPAYASPEQISGNVDDLDARTDIYSLGVLLYEVFVGASPYPPGLSLGQLLSAVENSEPRRPRSVNKGIPRNLEAVILKAIAKNPRQRYQTVDQLKADLQRCQADLPVAAPAPGFWFDLRALARRHPTRAAVFGSAAALIVIASVIVTAYALRLRQARDETLHAHQAAERVSEFLTNLALEVGEGVDLDSTLLPRLDEAAGWLDTEFGDDPWARARADVAFGRMYAKLRAWDKADQHLSTALATYRDLGRSDRRNVAETLRLLGLARAYLDKPGAVDLQREALAMIQRLAPADNPPLANYYAALGETLLRERGAEGQLEAERCFNRAIDLLGGDRPRFKGWTASVLTAKARGLANIGDVDQAVDAVRAAVALFKANGTSSSNQDYRTCRDLLSELSPAQEQAAQPTVKQKLIGRITGAVDHILIRAREPERLFGLFADDFGLPVVWPMRSYGSFKSGGVCAGNVNLEVLASPDRASSRTRLFGIAFAPEESMEQSVQFLDLNELPHSAPMPFMGTRPDGTSGIMWRTVILPDLQPPDSMVFLCEYGWDTTLKRRMLSKQLQSQGGGCLGWERVNAVIVGSRELSQAALTWTSHLGEPTTSAGYVWHFADGPAVHLVEANEDRLLSLTVQVRSLEDCQACLKRHGIPYELHDGVVSATGGLLEDLRIEFRESAAEQVKATSNRSESDNSLSPRSGE